jgi:hypothetical protein
MHYKKKGKQARLQELRDHARGVGLTVETWSPGDGTTHYRFFNKAPPSQTYFGPKIGIYTAIGLPEAWAFLGNYFYKLG